MIITYVRCRQANGRSVLVRHGTVGTFIDHGDVGDPEQSRIIDAPSAAIAAAYLVGATEGWDANESELAHRHHAQLADDAPPQVVRKVMQVPSRPVTTRHVPEVIDVPVRDSKTDTIDKPDLYALASTLKAALDLLDIARSLLEEDQQDRVASVVQDGRDMLAKL